MRRSSSGFRRPWVRFSWQWIWHRWGRCILCSRERCWSWWLWGLQRRAVCRRGARLYSCRPKRHTWCWRRACRCRGWLSRWEHCSRPVWERWGNRRSSLWWPKIWWGCCILRGWFRGWIPWHSGFRPWCRGLLHLRGSCWCIPEQSCCCWSCWLLWPFCGSVRGLLLSDGRVQSGWNRSGQRGRFRRGRPPRGMGE